MEITSTAQIFLQLYQFHSVFHLVSDSVHPTYSGAFLKLKSEVVGLKLPVEGAIDIVSYSKHLKNTWFHKL